ncbi:MAG: hypothetical protein K5665_03230 [Saccharofermentans sp.]|nr:hypothetical protein [Saccharofermentans sp.]
MLCEACGSTIPDDAATCPECGVSTSLFLVKPALQTVIQTVPDFVKTPGSQPEVQTDDMPANTPDTQQTSVQQQVASDTAEIPVNPKVQQEANQQRVIHKNTKRINVSVFISLFLGIIILFTNILFALGFSGSENYYLWIFVAWIVDLVFSCIGLSESKSIPESKPIAIAGLIICIIDFIITILVFWFVILPIMMRHIFASLPTGFPSGPI